MNKKKKVFLPTDPKKFGDVTGNKHIFFFWPKVSVHVVLSLSFFFFFFFYSVLRPFQDYFSSYETGQSVVEVKTGKPHCTFCLEFLFTITVLVPCHCLLICCCYFF